MKFFILNLISWSLLICAEVSFAADLRTSPGQPNTGDLYSRSIPLDTKRKIILPDGVWEVNHSFDDKQPRWHAAWRVITLVNRDLESPFPLVIVRYFLTSTPTWDAEDCEKKANSHGFLHDTQGTKGNKSICSVFYSFANPKLLLGSVLPKTYKFHWERALEKLSPEFISNLAPGQLLFEATASKGGSLYVKQEILVNISKFGINPEAFKQSGGSSNSADSERVHNWRRNYVKAMVQSFLEQTETPPSEYAFSLPSQQASDIQIAQINAEVDAKPSARDTSARLNADNAMEEKPDVKANAESIQKEQEIARLKAENLAKEREEARQRAEKLAKENDEARRKAEARAKAVEEAAQKEAAQKEAALREANKKLQELAERNQATNKPPPVPDRNAKRKALLIGNDKYQNVQPLRNARTDAQAMGQALAKLGYKVWVKTDLNRKDMQTAIRQFRSEVQGGDEVVIFYAGHAVQIASANYLLPTDIAGSSEDEVKDEAIQLQRLLDDMGERKTQITLALIDACRDNPFQKNGRSLGGRGLAPTTAATGQMIIFSAGAGQQALDRLSNDDKDPNGLFTRIFIKEMKTPGLRIDNLAREVRKKVVEAAKSVGHEQVPAIYDQVVGDFYFLP
jgi:hypothetical protein